MNQDQIDSIIRSLAKIIGGILVAHGATQMATVINAPDVIEAIGGVVTAGLSMYASHTSNATPPATPTPVKPTGAPMQGIGNP
jgi:hypothetical protein